MAKHREREVRDFVYRHNDALGRLSDQINNQSRIALNARLAKEGLNRLRQATYRSKHANKRSFKNMPYIEKEAIKKFYRLTPKGMHVDHIIPLSKGGEHIVKNLQYLSAKENISKGNRLKRLTLMQRLRNVFYQTRAKFQW